MTCEWWNVKCKIEERAQKSIESQLKKKLLGAIDSSALSYDPAKVSQKIYDSFSDAILDDKERKKIRGLGLNPKQLEAIVDTLQDEGSFGWVSESEKSQYRQADLLPLYQEIQKRPPIESHLLSLAKSGDRWCLLQSCFEDQSTARLKLAEKAEAFYSKGKGGHKPDKIVDVLIESLGDENQDLRQKASQALITIGQDKTGIPQLIELLKGDNPLAGGAAAFVLENLEEDAEQELVQAIKNEKTDFKIGAASAIILGRMDEAKKLCDLLKSGPEQTRSMAQIGLVSMGAEVIPDLLLVVQDDNKAYSKAAATIIAAIKDERALNVLADQLDNKDEKTRKSAAKLIVDKVEKLPKDVDALLSNFQSQSQFGVIDFLKEMREDPDEGVRLAAEASFLAITADDIVANQISESPVATEDDSEELVAIEDNEVYLISYFGGFRRECERIWKAHSEPILQADEKFVRISEKKVEVENKERSLLDRVMDWNKTKVVSVTSRKEVALKDILTKALQDQNDTIRLAAALLLMRMDGGEKILVRALGDKNPKVQETAADIFIDNGDPDSWATFDPIEESPDKLSKEDKLLLEALFQGVASSNPKVQDTAAEYLRLYGKAAAPGLEKLLRHDDESVRKRAQELLTLAGINERE